MSELTIGQLIKIILGLVVAVVVIGGVYLLFKVQVIDFFKNLPGGEGAGIIFSLIK